MITSKKALFYDARDGQKKAIIEIDIKNWSTNTEGVVYFVNNYAIDGDVKVLIETVERFRSWDQINSTNDYLESFNSYAGLTKKETEFKKIQQALLIETQTRPLYFSKAEDWILTQNITA